MMRRFVWFIKRNFIELYKGGFFTFLRKVRNLLFRIILVPVILLVRMLRPLVTIRFGEIGSEIIGHLAVCLELYQCERDAGMHPNTIDFFYTGKVSNEQLLKMWKRTKRIKFSSLASDLYWLNRHLPFGDKHIIEFRGRLMRDIHGLFTRFPPHLSFTPEEEKRGWKELKNLGLPDDTSFICFHGRDSTYYEKVMPPVRDWSCLNYRNVNIQNYLSAMEEMVQRGYFVFRMGAVVKEVLNANNPRIFDYALKARTDFLDIYLCAKCKFFVASSSGLSAVSWIFRKPIVWTNCIPLPYVVYACVVNQLFTPKKLWLIQEKRFMTFREIINSDVGRFVDTAQYERSGIKVIENTPEEITDVTIEMDERLKGTWQTTEEDEELQRRFWALFKPSELNQISVSRIGAAFLRTNIDLLN